MEVLKSLGFILALLLGLAAAILGVAGGGDGVWSHEGIVRIDRGKEQVFESLTDPAARKKWIDGLISCKVTPGPRLAQGSRLEETILVGTKKVTRSWLVSEYREAAALALEATVDGKPVKVRYALSALMGSGKTRLDFTTEVRYPDWYAKVIEPVLGHYELAAIEADHERLAAHAESTY